MDIFTRSKQKKILGAVKVQLVKEIELYLKFRWLNWIWRILDSGKPRMYNAAAMCYPGEPLVCSVLVFRILLDSVHHHDLHVPGDLQGGEPTGEADPLQAGQPCSPGSRSRLQRRST